MYGIRAALMFNSGNCSVIYSPAVNIFFINRTITIINEGLNKLSICLASNKQTLNNEKSHYIIFHRAQLKQSNINVSLSNISLEQVTFTKFLGVIIDEKLSFTRRISYIKTKISKGMGIIIKA